MSGWTIETLKEHIDQKIGDADRLQDAKWLAQDEKNKSQNEWRGTVGDMRGQYPTRAELASLESRFAAAQLETARTLSHSGGERVGEQSNSDNSRANVAIGISIASTIVAILIMLATLLIKRGG